MFFFSFVDVVSEVKDFVAFYMFINDIVHCTIYADELKWVSIYLTNKSLYHNP